MIMPYQDMLGVLTNVRGIYGGPEIRLATEQLGTELNRTVGVLREAVERVRTNNNEGQLIAIENNLSALTDAAVFLSTKEPGLGGELRASVRHVQATVDWFTYTFENARTVATASGLANLSLFDRMIEVLKL